MNILVLDPGRQSLSYTLVAAGEGALIKGKLEGYRGGMEGREILDEIKRDVQDRAELKNRDLTPDALAIRCAFGGDIFDGPALVSNETMEKLRMLIRLAPLHVPAILKLLEAAEKVYPETPAVLVFETSFFMSLPAREKNYALEAKTARGLDLIKGGFRGISHEAAARLAQLKIKKNDKNEAVKIVSICLDSRTEVAAVMGGKPIMVTGGATPLEGLPGDSTCGDMDVGILVILAQELKWGYEQINRMLTEESGLAGYVGKPCKLPEIFENPKEEYKLAKDIMLYKILQTCGAAAAVMGNIDGIIFSGKYKNIGNVIGPLIVNKLSFLKRAKNEEPLKWLVMEETMQESTAQIAAAKVMKNRKAVKAM
ncbi:MAG: hypothetical protein WCJ46_00705 [bacterium]